MSPIVVDSDVKLPDLAKTVHASLQAKGVAFAAFKMQLFLGAKPINPPIVELASEKDIGRAFAAENATAMRGLGFSCGGFVGSAVPDTIELHCDFTVDGTTASSKIASIPLTGNNVSRQFDIRVRFI